MNLDSGELHKILAEAFMLVRESQVTKLDWKKWSKLLTCLCVVIGVTTIGSALYFIATRRIGPLMLDVAGAVLILCVSLYEQGQRTSLVEKEFREYRDAVAAMIEYLQTHLESSLIDEDLLALIRRAQKEENDLTQIFEALANHDSENLDTMLEMVVASTQANIIQMTNAKKNPDAPAEDLNVKA